MDDECRRILDELDVYLDGECGEDLRRLVNVHLSDCPPCSDRAGFEQQLRALIARKCRDAAPPGLIDRVIAAVRSS